MRLLGYSSRVLTRDGQPSSFYVDDLKLLGYVSRENLTKKVIFVTGNWLYLFFFNFFFAILGARPEGALGFRINRYYFSLVVHCFCSFNVVAFASLSFRFDNKFFYWIP